MTLPILYGFEPQQGSERAPRSWPRFMTARVAADYSDSSPWTIRRHVQPCGRRGRNFVYAIEAVEEWMRGQAAKIERTDAPVLRKRASRSRDLTKPRDQRRAAVEAHESDVAA